MPLVMPPTTTALGNKLVVFLTEPPADPDGIPTLDEVNAGLFAGCHIYGDFVITPEQNTGEGPRKLCSQYAPTQLGQVSYPAVEIQYSYVPQELAEPGSEGNEVYEALTPGEEVTAVTVDGLDGKTDVLEEGTVCDVYLMECGVRAKSSTGDGEFDELAITQQLIVVGGEPIVADYPLTADASS